MVNFTLLRNTLLGFTALALVLRSRFNCLRTVKILMKSISSSSYTTLYASVLFQELKVIHKYVLCTKLLLMNQILRKDVG